MNRIQLGGLCLLALLAACARQTPPHGVTSGAAAVDGARISAADKEPGSWMSYGRTYDEQRFSPLASIDAGNVDRLKLAWHYDLDADHRAQEATPVVVDGVMYVTSAFSKVFALDPTTGRQLWVFDPKVPKSTGVKGCCDAVNRGVAVWNGKVYVGTFDGRLIALDARTGKPVWSVLTVDDTKSYTISGAPRVIKGKVIIGNAGGEYVTRGYISAYDAETGRQVWRFYTVPGEPGKADGAASDQVLESKARATWKGEFWKLGGGGTVWDSMAYDPKLDLLYFGTDNGSPWNAAIRSPGGGDNLFIASIIAVRPDTGEYVWHFQETPGESWDYSAVQHIVLADLTIDGRTRQVLMQAPKNGVFYVLDRATGELVSARPYTMINWATGFDPKTGRPTVDPKALYGDTGKSFTSIPGASGAHSWQPMAYSPQTHLMYIPVIGLSFGYAPEKSFKVRSLGWNTGVDFNAGSLPEDPKVLEQIQQHLAGHLSAWDPVAQREVWSTPYPTPWNGGVLATAGNLVFQGTASGELAAYRAGDGKRVWSVQTHTGILAPPMTYEAGGAQYVALELGWGGAFGLAAGQLARDSHAATNVPRVLAFRLDGTDVMPEPPAPADVKLDPPPDAADSATVSEGKEHYHSYCSVCHGDSAVSGGVLPDLRYSQALSRPELWQSIAHDGVLEANGMVSFKSQLTPKDLEAVRAYVIHRANQTKPH
jgi:alcohol dehydrogenase (cytochrome c)/quinohemoprotein ethanol dehydrogenase